MKRRSRRSSLSDWWSRPEGARGETPDPDDPPAADSDDEFKDMGDSDCGSPAKLLFSPPKRESIQSFCIADDSDTQSLCSPRKRAAMTPGNGSLMGSPPVSARGPSIDTAMMTILRGICADYFENNVAPILRFVQQTQEQIMVQLKDVVATVDKKANADDVLPMEEIERVAVRIASSRADDSKVAVQIRLEQLAAAMNQKANAVNVPTLAQLALKANAKDVPTSAHLAELSAAVGKKADAVKLEELSSALKCKADMAEVPSLSLHSQLELRVQAAERKTDSELELRVRAAEQKTAALSEELQELRKMDSHTAARSAEPADINAKLDKVKAVFLAGGMRVERQMKDLRKDMQKLSDHCQGQSQGEVPGHADNRFRQMFPGRKLDSDSVSMQSDNHSDSCHSDRLSVGTSVNGSLTSTTLDPQEKADLRKMHTFMAAAGTAFSRETKDIRNQMRDMRTELNAVKGHLDSNRKGK